MIRLLTKIILTLILMIGPFMISDNVWICMFSYFASLSITIWILTSFDDFVKSVLMFLLNVFIMIPMSLHIVPIFLHMDSIVSPIIYFAYIVFLPAYIYFHNAVDAYYDKTQKIKDGFEFKEEPIEIKCNFEKENIY